MKQFILRLNKKTSYFYETSVWQLVWLHIYTKISNAQESAVTSWTEKTIAGIIFQMKIQKTGDQRKL